MASAATEARYHRIPVMRIHLPASERWVMDPVPALYTIRVNGHLGAMMLSAFPAMVPRWHGADTVLTGLLDRSALYGCWPRSTCSAWTCSRCASSSRTANHRNQVTVAHNNARAADRSPSSRARWTAADRSSAPSLA